MSESLNPALYDGAAVTKASRSAKGLKGGVVALVYIAAFLNPKGQSIVGLTGGLPGDDAMMDLSSMRSPEMAASVFGDLPQSEAGEDHFFFFSSFFLFPSPLSSPETSQKGSLFHSHVTHLQEA